MSYKNIEKSREIRLWIGQIIIPVMTAGILLVANPNVRNWVKDKYFDAKTALKNKANKS